MSFNYSLQKILDLKSNEKTQAEWHLSEAIAELSNEENDLCRLYSEMTAIQETLLNDTQNSSTISNLLLIQQYLEHLEQLIINKNKGIAASKNNVENKQQNLSSKMLDEKVWVKAKEKAYQKFSSDISRKDQNELDEIASTQHGLKE
ncbi:MAG TPA: flagellar export protein FliJ [Bacilli bacterium]